MTKIGQQELQEAMTILNRYRAGKAALEQRIVENEQWYRLRHWECMRREGGRDPVEPSSGWLFNAIANKLADAMDNYPAPVVKAREQNDTGEARKLEAILPVILDQCEFEETYSRVQEYKLKFGTGVYGVFWDSSACGGLGDVSIRKIDIIDLYWEAGIADIQDSRHVFYLSLTDSDLLRSRYPWLKETGGGGAELRRYAGEERADSSGKSLVVDWYYKKPGPDGRQILHYCKFCGSTVLFATENEEEYALRGLYDHGKYPFVFDTLYRVEGSPCGFGFIDVAKSAQEYIDRGSQAILRNLLAGASPRYFIRSDGAVNEEEYADLSRDLIHVDGNLGQDSVVPVQTRGLDGIYLSVINNKIEELKEVTGNRDVSTGGTTGGATAASAIAAMQEAGSKLSRAGNKAAFRSFRQVILLVIELIRQFYDMPRQFRILGEGGGECFTDFSNRGLLPQQQGGEELGLAFGLRMPLFDVMVEAEKKSPYSRLSQNEMALQFFAAGLFDPRLADQALICLEMMDFDRKEQLMERISANAQLLQSALQPPAAPRVPAAAGKIRLPAGPGSGWQPAHPRCNCFSGAAGLCAPVRQRLDIRVAHDTGRGRRYIYAPRLRVKERNAYGRRDHTGPGRGSGSSGGADAGTGGGRPCGCL